MIEISSLSGRTYACLLRFYPEDLRRLHGSEMLLVFADDLAASRRESGMRGVLRVWRWTASEFLRVALPAWVSSPAVRVPAISLTLFAGMAVSLLPGPFGFRVRFFLLLPFFSTPFIALLSFWVCRQRHVNSLT